MNQLVAPARRLPLSCLSREHEGLRPLPLLPGVALKTLQKYSRSLETKHIIDTFCFYLSAWRLIFKTRGEIDSEGNFRSAKCDALPRDLT